MKKIKVILADDHRMFLAGMKEILKNDPNIEIVGTATNGLEALKLLEMHPVDIAILDISMPEMNGIEATKKIKEDYPRVKVLILTMSNDLDFITDLRAVGVDGYILKEKGEDELLNAIYAIRDGKQYFGQEVKDTFFYTVPKKKNDVNLTKKEEEVLRLIGRGKTTPEIAKELKNAESTIEQHRRNLLSKTGCRNSLELVRWAVENGYK